MYYFQGNMNEAYQVARDAIRFAQESGYTYSKAWAYPILGISCYGKGLFEDAIHHLLKGSDFCEKLNLSMWEAIARWILGEIYFEVGEYEESRDQYGATVRLLEHGQGHPSWKAINKIGAVMADLMIGNKDIDLELVCGYLSEGTLKYAQAWKARYIAEVLLNVDDRHSDEAEHWIRKSIEAAKQNHMIWHLARGYALYAELCKRQGDQTRAKEHRAEAINIYKECGADGWVTKTGEELAKLS